MLRRAPPRAVRSRRAPLACVLVLREGGLRPGPASMVEQLEQPPIRAASRGNPVDSSGSITPAAEGSSAQFAPQTWVRNATRGECTHGSTARVPELIADRRKPRARSQPPRVRRRSLRHRIGHAAPALVMPLLKRRPISSRRKNVMHGRVIRRIRRRASRAGTTRPSARRLSKCV